MTSSNQTAAAKLPTRTLANVATGYLQQLLLEIRHGKIHSKLSRLQLQAMGLASAANDLMEALHDVDLPSIATILELLLAERNQITSNPIELVWTGPQAKQSSARQTSVVMRELFASATTSILIAGFRFDHGKELFAPLHQAMMHHDLKVQIFVDVPQKPTKYDSIHSANAVDFILDQFLHRNWSFGPPWPELYFDPRTAESHSVGQGVSMHAKCVVVDECKVLVGSANFTQRGQERNYELGLLLDDADLARRIVAQWNALVGCRIFVRHQ